MLACDAPLHHSAHSHSTLPTTPGTLQSTTTILRARHQCPTKAALPLAASPASSSRPVPPNSRLERVIARRQARGALLREPPNTQGEAPPQYEDVEDAAPFVSLPPYTRLEPVFHPDIVSDPCPPFNACAWSTSQLVAPRFDANSAPRVTWPVNAPLFWQAGVLNQINNPNHTVTNLLPPSLGHLPGGNTGAQPSNAHSNAPTQAPGRVRDASAWSLVTRMWT